MKMDVVLIGNSQPAVILGDPDTDGNVRVAVFGGEQYVPAHDLYNTDGSQPFGNLPKTTPAANGVDAGLQARITDLEAQLAAAQGSDTLEEGEKQPDTAAGA